jgi:FMN phosphatase YigB (HAD superfamily)
MGKRNVTIRAVLCDIYKTLLDVGPPPDDAGQRWEKLCRAALPQTASIPLAEFVGTAETVIKREHAVAKAAGIPFPEIFWPAVAREAWPALSTLNSRALGDFLFEHAQVQRVVRLMPGAAEVLRSLVKRNVRLGVVSNSQPYTLRELDAAFATAGLSRAMFAPDLSFLSFEHGFSKPDPHVFRILTARLEAQGISPEETLMVGDRLDNDIEPARAHGWQTWQLVSTKHNEASGNWRELLAWLESNR